VVQLGAGGRASVIMRITITATGSRGDVQPYIALAVGLRQAGHAVCVATHDEFRPLLDGRGIEYAPVRGNPRDLLNDERAHSMLAAQGNALKFLREFTALLAPGARQMALDCREASRGSDAIVLSNTGLVAGFRQIAAALGVPYCTGLLQPVTPTRAFASPFLPEFPGWLPFGRGVYNLWSHRLFRALFRRFFDGLTRMVRHELELPPLSRREARPRLEVSGAPLLYAFSPSVVAPPDDWPSCAHVTGYWPLDRPAGWRPSPELRAFLDAGRPPVYVGFGSMTSRDPEATTALVVEALARAGRRGVLLTGSGALSGDDLPDEIFPLESAPHDWLFPRMAAVVHHGGAGTTSAGLRAGVPSIVVPFFADQPFWARTVHRLGAGPRPIPRRRLTATRLVAAITQATSDDDMRRRAAALGERIRAEDGVSRAVNIMLEHFGRTRTEE